ncbi:hypothetical protein, partial [Pseudomonas aeruginosa]
MNTTVIPPSLLLDVDFPAGPGAGAG